MRRGFAPCAIALSAAALGLPATASGAGELKFAATPALPTLTTVTLTAKSATVNTTMTNISVADTRGTKLGWNITLNGQSGEKKSAVFAQYCPKAKCGAN